MERFVKSLNDRLLANERNTAGLMGIMGGAIAEMNGNGVFQKLPQELQKKLQAASPEERIDIETEIAKDYVVENFIKSSRPVTLQKNEIGRRVTVRYDARFLNSIVLCIQGGLESLYLSEAYKRCKDNVMPYYIQTDASGENYRKFRYKIAELEGMYENFQINFMPVSDFEIPIVLNTEPILENEGFFQRFFKK